MAAALPSTDAIRRLFVAEIAVQEAVSAQHLASSYWIDRQTGRNIGLDERDALRAIQRVDPAPLVAEHNDPTLYLDRLLAELAVVADRFRAEAADPDGYGIATIGTVIRRLSALKTGRD